VPDFFAARPDLGEERTPGEVQARRRTRQPMTRSGSRFCIAISKNRVRSTEPHDTSDVRDGRHVCSGMDSPTGARLDAAATITGGSVTRVPVPPPPAWDRLKLDGRYWPSSRIETEFVPSVTVSVPLDALPEEPAAGCEPVPSLAGDRREGRDGRGQTGKHRRSP
jgi:hypothetical protein